MHHDIIFTTDVIRPKKPMHVVYFSSTSNNTHRFIEKLGLPNTRIPIDQNSTITVDHDYILICPSYGGGLGDNEGIVPKQVIKFLNNEHNRRFCKGVVSSGNTNFNDTFAYAGVVLSKKLQVPLLYQFELLGTKEDVQKLLEIMENFYVDAE